MSNYTPLPINDRQRSPLVKPCSSSVEVFANVILPLLQRFLPCIIRQLLDQTLERLEKNILRDTIRATAVRFEQIKELLAISIIYFVDFFC